MTKKKDKQKQSEEIIINLDPSKHLNIPFPDKDKTIDRNIYLFDEIDEKTSVQVVAVLNDIMEEIDEEESEESDIYLHINTVGGDVTDMFAIVDSIEYAKKRGFTVHTIGLGKVMSAGLVILSCGTKGCRRLGKNTRLMFHEVQGGTSGTYDNIKNEYKEIEYAQNEYIKALLTYTVKDKNFYKSLLDRKNNYYFTSKEAIEWGIADEIL
jgi:ATP-dependent Clp protease protease subunit